MSDLAESIPFELTLTDGIGTADLEAELRSPLLDPALHPKGVATVAIDNDMPRRKKKQAVLLDSFIFESIVEYLRRQVEIRRTLERELVADQRDWDPDGK